MANKRHKPEEIVSKLRQVDVLRGQGMTMADAIRQIGVTSLTYYRWRKTYGGMGTDQVKELKKLQKENEQLRKAVADLTLDKQILAEAAKGSSQALPGAGVVLIRCAVGSASQNAELAVSLVSIVQRSVTLPRGETMKPGSSQI